MKRPQDSDWDQFWSQDRAKKYSRLSWSKKRILSILSPYLMQGKTALDAGCGSGFFSKVFSDEGMETVALDYSENALQRVAQMTNGCAKLVKGDLLAENLQELLQTKFSLIFTDGLFEHFRSEDQDKILQNFLRVLNTDGIIVTFVPNRWSPWQCIRPFLMPGIEETPFVLKELCELHQRNGLEIVTCGGINVFPFRISPERLLGSRFGMLLYVIAKSPVI